MTNEAHHEAENRDARCSVRICQRPSMPPILASMQIDVRPVADLSPEDQRELNELELRCFGPPEHHALRLVPAPAADTKYVVRVWDGDVLISCLWITERTILVDGRRTFVAGIRGVRTAPRTGGAGLLAQRCAAQQTSSGRSCGRSWRCCCPRKWRCRSIGASGGRACQARCSVSNPAGSSTSPRPFPIALRWPWCPAEGKYRAAASICVGCRGESEAYQLV